MKQRDKQLRAAADVIRLRGALAAAEARYDALVSMTDRRQKASRTPAVPKVQREPAAKAATGGRIPDLILDRINGSPARSFKAEDFADITGGDVKPIFTALTRLAKPTKTGPARITKLSRGLFQAFTKSAPPPQPNGVQAHAAQAGGATAASKVLDYVRQHPGKWLNTRAVTEGMGLSIEEHRGAVQAALGRLATKGLVEKARGDFRFTEKKEAQHA